MGVMARKIIEIINRGWFLKKISNRNFLLLLFVILALTIFPAMKKRWLYYPDCTGSYGDHFQTCASCHYGQIYHIDTCLYSNIPSEGFAAGDTYKLYLNMLNHNVKSFEITVEHLGINKGKFIYNPSYYYGWDSSSVLSNGICTDSLITVDWVAPDTIDCDSITVYAAINYDWYGDTIILSKKKYLPKPLIIENNTAKNIVSLYQSGNAISFVSCSNINSNYKYKIYSPNGTTLHIGNIGLVPKGFFETKILLPESICNGLYFFKIYDDKNYSNIIKLIL